MSERQDSIKNIHQEVPITKKINILCKITLASSAFIYAGGIGVSVKEKDPTYFAASQVAVAPGAAAATYLFSEKAANYLLKEKIMTIREE